MPEVAAVIVAAGRGLRAAADLPESCLRICQSNSGRSVATPC